MNIPKQAVEAVIKASYPRTLFISEAELVLTAALPHIRRAVIEELIEKYEAKRDSRGITASQRLHTYDCGATVRVLRAELEGDGE